MFGYVFVLIWVIARGCGHAGSYRLRLRSIHRSLDAKWFRTHVGCSVFVKPFLLFLRVELRLRESYSLCAICCNSPVVAQASRLLVRDYRLVCFSSFLDHMRPLRPTSNFQSFGGTIPTWLDPCMVLSPRTDTSIADSTSEPCSRLVVV